MTIKLSVGILVGLALWSTSAPAESKPEFPFSGYFSQQYADSPEGFKQALCAFAFFKQHTDGRVEDYDLDLPLYEKTGQVRYINSKTSQCDYDPLTKTDECTVLTSQTHQKTGFKTYELIEGLSNGEFQIQIFGQREVLGNYLKSKFASSTQNGLISKRPLLLHRCIGFSDEVLSEHIDQKLVMNPKSLESHYEMKFDKKRIPDALRIMEKISLKALNATLPGQ
jgi:hypothetical protein